jgi:hypothetical protein
VASKERVHLGTYQRTGIRRHIYRTADALEIEETEDYEIRRWRLFYDEILLVTYHRAIRWSYLWASVVLLALGFGLGGLLYASAGLGTAAVSAMIWGPALLAIGLLTGVRHDIVTVFGKRTRAQIEFFVRKARARETFILVCALARDHQARVRRELAAAAPAVLPPPGGEIP